MRFQKQCFTTLTSLSALVLVSCFETEGDDDQPAPDPAGITEEELAAAMDEDFLCTAFTNCNPEFDCSIFTDMEGGETEGCTYDPVKAQECVEGEWTCDGEGEFAYAVAPDACAAIYTDCPEPPGATEEEYYAHFTFDYVCDLFVSCNPDFDCSVIGESDPSDFADCTFDPVAALECMEGEWTCEGEGEFAYVLPPEICGFVYDCPLE
jgi:hypothetical protein